MNVTLSLTAALSPTFPHVLFFNSFRSSFQQWPLLLLHLLSPPALKIHCLACQSAQPHPPCPVSCRQVFHLYYSTALDMTVLLLVIRNCMCSICSYLMCLSCLRPFQVCPQSLCSPPPPAPPSARSLHWILPPPPSTPPPRYQVGDFSERSKHTSSICTVLLLHQWIYNNIHLKKKKERHYCSVCADVWGRVSTQAERKHNGVPQLLGYVVYIIHTLCFP